MRICILGQPSDGRPFFIYRNMETGQEVNWEMCTGIASSVIAICALILSVWQGYLTRLHNRISVKPHLTTWSYDYIPGKGLYSIDLINNGIGPAVIKKFIIKVDGFVVNLWGHPLEGGGVILISD